MTASWRESILSGEIRARIISMTANIRRVTFDTLPKNFIGIIKIISVINSELNEQSYVYRNERREASFIARHRDKRLATLHINLLVILDVSLSTCSACNKETPLIVSAMFLPEKTC